MPLFPTGEHETVYSYFLKMAINFTLNVRSGTETKYSWKNAEVKKTTKEAWNFEPLDLSIGMYI